MKTMELLDRIKMVRTKKVKTMTQKTQKTKMTPVRKKAIQFIRNYNKHIPESYFEDKTNAFLLCWVNPMDRDYIRGEFEVEGTLND